MASKSKRADRTNKHGSDYTEDQIAALTDLLLPAKRDARPNEVACLKCGWVSFAISKTEAKMMVEDYAAWHRVQPDEVKAKYPPESSLDQYRCLRCHGTEFRPAKAGDAPHGVTLNPVIWEPVSEE